MLKGPEKQHVIGVENMEKETKQMVEKLSRNFADVTYEVVPYQEFANGETKVVLKESVRGRYTHIISDIEKISGQLSSNKFNNLLMRDNFIRWGAINHGAKGLTMDTIPYYNIVRQNNIHSTDHLPTYDGKSDNFNQHLFDYFEDKKRMFPQQQEQIHLIGTQDTANMVNKVQQYLISEIGSHAVSSEISLYNESPQGMTQVRFQSPVEKKHVYIFGDVNGRAQVEDFKISYNDRLIQTFLLGDRAKQYGAKTINEAYTCFPHSRQDKPTQGGLKERVEREPSSAQWTTEILQNFLGLDYCLTMDMHNAAVINNSNQTNFVNLYTGRMVQHVANILKQQNKYVVLSPMDEGGLKKISSISKDLKFNYLTVLKKRDYSQINTVDRIDVYGDVERKDILIHDDILDTGGSLIKLIQELKKRGARSINVVITHGMFNKDALLKLQELHNQGLFENIYVSNTVYRDELFYPDFVKVIDASRNFADPIKSIYLGKSINYNYGVNLVA